MLYLSWPQAGHLQFTLSKVFKEMYTPGTFLRIIGRKHIDPIYKQAGGQRLYASDYARYIAVQNQERLNYARTLESKAESLGALASAEERITAARPCGAFELACYGLKLKLFFSSLLTRVALGAGVLIGGYLLIKFLAVKR